MLYQLATIPDGTSLMASVGNASTGSFAALIPIALALAGLVVGGLLVAFIFELIPVALEWFLTRVFGGGSSRYDASSEAIYEHRRFKKMMSRPSWLESGKPHQF